MVRSHKPIVWGLFAAGGTLAAFLMPAIIVLCGTGIAAGLVAPELLYYDTVLMLLRHPLMKLIVFGVMVLITWHAAHRMRITAHDLGIRADTVVAVILYSIAAAATLLLAVALLKIH